MHSSFNNELEGRVDALIQLVLFGNERSSVDFDGKYILMLQDMLQDILMETIEALTDSKYNCCQIWIVC